MATKKKEFTERLIVVMIPSLKEALEMYSRYSGVDMSVFARREMIRSLEEFAGQSKDFPNRKELMDKLKSAKRAEGI